MNLTSGRNPEAIAAVTMSILALAGAPFTRWSILVAVMAFVIALRTNGKEVDTLLRIALMFSLVISVSAVGVSFSYGGDKGPQMKDWTGKTLGSAYQSMDDSYDADLDEHDLSVQDPESYISSSDRDVYLICSQSLPVGAYYKDRDVVFDVVKAGDQCRSRQEQATLVAAAEAEEERVRTEEATAARARREQEQAAQEAIDSAPVVLADVDIEACAIVARYADQAVTVQDKSDVAQSVRAYSDKSPDQRFVEAGQLLTDKADAGKVFLVGVEWWDYASSTFSDLCIRGGYNDLPQVTG